MPTLTGRAIRKMKEYQNKPKQGGFRSLILHRIGYNAKNDGFCDFCNKNKHNHSRTYKKGKKVKTVGREPNWLKLSFMQRSERSELCIE